MILFRLGNFKVGVRRGHFLGDPTLSDRSDGDLLMIDLFLIGLTIVSPRTRILNAMRRFMVDKYDIAWHESLSKAKSEAFKLAYQDGKKYVKEAELMYKQKIKEHDAEFRKLQYENTYLKEAFKILTNNKEK